MEADSGRPEVEAHEFNRIEEQVGFLIEWQARVGPAISRLAGDQEYRDKRMADRARLSKRIAFWLGIAAAALAVAGSLARSVLEGAHLLGL